MLFRNVAAHLTYMSKEAKIVNTYWIYSGTSLSKFVLSCFDYFICTKFGAILV